MSSQINVLNSYFQTHNQKHSSFSAEDLQTKDLQQKMRQLELQIQSLLSLKRQSRTSSRLSDRLQISVQSIRSQNNQKNKNQNKTPLYNSNKSYIQRISISQNSKPSQSKDVETNFKNNKINYLMTQLSSQKLLQNSQKSSILKKSSESQNKTSVQDLKNKLQKIDGLNHKKKKRVALNLMELKGVKHEVQSNIFNVTVAEIMTEQHQKYEMIKQIKGLKDKLKNLQRKKQQKSSPQRFTSKLQDFFNTQQLRSEQNGAGKIFSKSRITNSEFQNENRYDLNFQREKQRNSIQLRRNSNPFAWNPEISLTAKKPIINRMKRSGRFYSTISIQGNKLSNKYQQQQVSKKPLFKILKRKFNAQDLKKKYLSPQKITTPTNLLPQMKIQQLKINQQIPLDLMPNFRQYINNKLIQINFPPQPTPHDPQSDLQSLGRVIFSLFDIYVQDQVKKKGTQYKVTKYKNCVLFRLNEQTNIVWYFDGKFYYGGWDISLKGQSKKQGFGIEIIPLSYIYQGYFLNNKRQGYGIMTNHFKSDKNKNMLYEGFWKQGLKHGKSYQIEQDLQYLGDFIEGLQTGQCKIRTVSTYYQGNIKQSIKEGKGHQILKNGDQYFGEFKSNMFHGKGQYRWKNGAYFYGDFVQGLRKGKGTWISNINSTLFDSYQGEYNQNKKNGHGVYQWANGTIYEGYFKNDLRHDEGLMKYPNGKAAKFIWKQGDKAYKIYSEEQQMYRRRTGLQTASKISLTMQNQQQNLQRKPQKELQEPILRASIQQLQKLNLFLYKKNDNIIN